MCDGYKKSNPNLRAAFGRLPADQQFASLYVNIVGGESSFSLGAVFKSIRTIIDELTGWAKAIPIEDQRVETFARVFSE